MCASLCTCSCMCTSIFMQVHVVYRSQRQVFSSIFFSALYLKKTFTEPKSCQFRQSWWSGGPKDPQVSSFQVLYYRQALWHLAFLHGIWELNSDLHTSIASSLLTEPSPQPLIQNFWVLSTSLWRLSKSRKGGVQMKQTFEGSTYVVTYSVKLNVM